MTISVPHYCVMLIFLIYFLGSNWAPPYQVSEHLFLSYRLDYLCLFGFFRPTWEFFTRMETSPLPATGCKVGPMLGTHGHYIQWWFFSVPHLLWHGPCVYNCYLRGPVRLTPTVERLAAELTQPALMIVGLSGLGFELTTFRLRGDRSKPLHSRCGVYLCK